MKRLVVVFLLLTSAELYAQPFIKLVEPSRETVTVARSRQFITGSTCKTCHISIDGNPVKVYSSGGFAYELNLQPGRTTVNLVATATNGSETNKKLYFNYAVPPPPDTVKTLDITRIETFPEGNLLVKAGDRIRFRVKGLPGCSMLVNNTTPLYETRVSAAQPMPGIYQGEYVVSERDSFLTTRLPVTIIDSANNRITRHTTGQVSVFGSLMPDMVITRGRLAHLLFGLGEDRLGGAKIGYIDSLIPLHITGKAGSLYRVQLSPYRTAWIPDDVVEFLPKGTFKPSSLTGNWRVSGDSLYDYVQVNLFSRLPYQSFQLVDPSKIVIDIFGATNNTNWITQLESAREVKNVQYEQIEDGVLRVTIELKHAQHWGYQVYYQGNNLIVKVRREPASQLLKGLVIAVDAGHGGGNTGASGPTGSSEKMLALAVSLKLKKALQQQGAHVIMTRNTELFVDNKERILLYRDSMPHLLVSIHLNSSGDPVNVGGTGTFYRYVGFRNLSQSIYRRMLELGLKEYGNTGSFNFMLNSPTEYPNSLVEMLFISNPEEEALILDEAFQQRVADKIVVGIRDFLEASKGKLN